DAPERADPTSVLRSRGVSIPVIDLGGSEAELVDRIDIACREIGFFTIVYHGVPATVVGEPGRPRARSSTCRRRTNCGWRSQTERAPRSTCRSTTRSKRRRWPPAWAFI